MKAEIELKGKDGIKKQIDSARQMKTNLTYAETVIMPKLQAYEFRVPIKIDLSVSAYDCSVSIRLASTNPTDEESALVVADVVRLFGLKLDRNFDQYNGKFYWSGRNYTWSEEPPVGERPMNVYIGNISQGKCEIRKVTKEVKEMREVYEAHCE